LKYHNKTLSFYNFIGEIGFIEHDFITEKSVLSAEKQITNMQLEGEIEDKELDNI